MKLTLPDIHNIHKGKSAFIIGLGNQLNDHKEKLVDMSHNDPDTVFLSCNEWDVKVPEVKMDYWVLASTVNTVSQRHQRFNQQGIPIIYEEGLDYTPRDKVASLLSVDYLPYDQRHLDGICKDGPRKGGKNWCCDFYRNDRPTIQQYLATITGTTEVYTKINTVALNMLSLAIIMGCDPIYIFGVNLDYSTPYVDGSFNAAYEQGQNILKDESAGSLESFGIINEAAKKVGVDVYNTDANSVIGEVFKTILWNE